MNMVRRYTAAASALVLALMLAACTEDSTESQRAENDQQGKISTGMVKNQPLPVFDYSQLRQNLIEIETAQAKGVQSTTFFFLAGVPDPVSTCTSIGMPVATTTGLSNPWQIDRDSDSQGKSNSTIGQMEPNGTYPGDSQGTYVMCVDSNGRPYADYWEGEVKSVMAPAKWDEAKHTVVLVGAPTGDFSKNKTK